MKAVKSADQWVQSLEIESAGQKESSMVVHLVEQLAV